MTCNCALGQELLVCAMPPGLPVLLAGMGSHMILRLLAIFVPQVQSCYMTTVYHPKSAYYWILLFIAIGLIAIIGRLMKAHWHLIVLQVLSATLLITAWETSLAWDYITCWYQALYPIFAIGVGLYAAWKFIPLALRLCYHCGVGLARFRCAEMLCLVALLCIFGIGHSILPGFTPKRNQSAPSHLDTNLSALKPECSIDWLADTGDGWDASFSVASLIAQPVLNFSTLSLLRSRVLLVGGDLVYPSPTLSDFKTRFVDPFETAFPESHSTRYHGSYQRPKMVFWLTQIGTYFADALFHKIGNHPRLAPLPPRTPYHSVLNQSEMWAIPGNHDALDGGAIFEMEVIERHQLGGWSLPQTSTYFALPRCNGWLLFAISDQQAAGGNADIDKGQFDYFVSVLQNDTTARRALIFMHSPFWVLSGKVGTRLGKLMSLVKERGIELVALIAGDLHYYSHYAVPALPEGSFPHLVVSGGGGAFMHSTWDLPKKLKVELPWAIGVYELQMTYPTDYTSLILAANIWSWQPAWGVALALFTYLLLQAWLALLKYTSSLEIVWTSALAPLSLVPGFIILNFTFAYWKRHTYMFLADLAVTIVLNVVMYPIRVVKEEIHVKFWEIALYVLIVFNCSWIWLSPRLYGFLRLLNTTIIFSAARVQTNSPAELCLHLLATTLAALLTTFVLGIGPTDGMSLVTGWIIPLSTITLLAKLMETMRQSVVSRHLQDKFNRIAAAVVTCNKGEAAQVSTGVLRIASFLRLGPCVISHLLGVAIVAAQLPVLLAVSHYSWRWTDEIIFPAMGITAYKGFLRVFLSDNFAEIFAIGLQQTLSEDVVSEWLARPLYKQDSFSKWHASGEPVAWLLKHSVELIERISTIPKRSNLSNSGV